MDFNDALQTAQALGLTLPTPAWILGATLFSVLGMAAWVCGKRLQEPRVRWLGLALMLYSYLTSATWLLYGVGVALCAAVWWAWPRRD